jgi:TatD DNase family protein
MNEPGYVAHVAEFIATLKDVSLRDVAQQTTDNFFNLFKVPRD